MQITGKANNTHESVTKADLRRFDCKELMTPKRLWLFTFTLMMGLMFKTSGVRADPVTPPTLAANSELENTERNVRDSSDTTLTPEDQTETSGDIEITAAIRQSVVNDKSLSLNAHNAKIITRNGVVTLRGPVENSAEKIKLQLIAKKTQGVKQVDNQLETKAP